MFTLGKRKGTVIDEYQNQLVEYWQYLSFD